MERLTHKIIFRVINGRYERPYERAKISQDYLILARVAKDQLRPELPPSTPEELADIVTRMWSGLPDDRPTITRVG